MICRYHSWQETENEYKWLTKLITFVNNGSLDAKQYVVEQGVPDSNNSNDLISNCCKHYKLNMKYINVIISFIKSIGNYFKHGTYIKWYKKELDRILLFNEKISIQEIISECTPDMKELFLDYYQTLQKTNTIH